MKNTGEQRDDAKAWARDALRERLEYAQRFAGDCKQLQDKAYARAILAEQERDTARRFSDQIVAQKNALDNDLMDAIAERDRLRVALESINQIRNSIVGTQTINFSAHAYPLVKALNDAGYTGLGYEEARSRAKTLIDQRDDSIARADKAERERDSLRLELTGLESVRVRGNAELIAQRDCAANLRDELAALLRKVLRNERIGNDLACQIAATLAGLP